MRRGGSKSQATAATRGPDEPQGAVFMPITAEQLLFVLLVCLVCIGGAVLMGDLMKGTGILLPDFLWALLIGMAVRNVLAPLAVKAGLEAKPINDRAVQAFGSLTLSLFLIMALMSMRILELATMAGPLLLIVVVNALATAAFAYFVTSRAMGGDHDAAVISGGQVAAGLATTAVGMSVMQTLAERHGPAPLAFLLIPIVGAFFADIANAIVVQAFFALPALGF
jgi:ESS family glutamate:Na+ symporter